MGARLTAMMLAVAGALVLGAAPAAGQGRMSVDVSTAAVTFATPGATDFDAGFIDHPGLDLTVTSRPGGRAWELRVRALNPTLGPGKPVTELLWRRAGTTAWTPLTATDAMVLQGDGDQTVSLEFRLLLSWAGDPPGAYATDLQFTALRI